MTSGITARLQQRWPGFALDVALQLPGRGVSALFGPSGCGKTTCLRALAGLLRTPGGQLQVNGETWQDDARGLFVPTWRRPIGYVAQDAGLFAHLTVRGNVEYGLQRVSAAQRKVALSQAVALLGIGPLMDRRPQALSGGERQRVAMARALATSPRLLLLDEPLAALDAARKAEVLPYLEQLHTELDIPMVYVSHAIDEVARLADHLVLLREGRVVASGPVAQALAGIDSPALLGDDTGALLEGEILERDARWQLARVGFDGGSLWLRDGGDPVGRRVRVRVLARDVSLATALPDAATTSIQNLLPAQVRDIVAGTHPSQALVRLACGTSALLASVTARAVSQLALRPGQPVWAQVKSAALVRQESR